MTGLLSNGAVPLQKAQGGYLLITVVVMLFLLATVGVLLTHDTSISANTTSAELETARADYVARAGMQHALWRASNNACLGDVTIAATTLGADSYTATISGAAAGTRYVLHADQDAWIRDDDPDRNNGTTAANHIKQEGGKVEQVLTRFDLSALAANAQINSAVAWFHLKSGKEHSDGPIAVREITADWAETAVTWESFAGAYRSGTIGTIPAQDVGDVWVSVNLTGLVQAWVNGQPNHGILFETQAEGIHTEYTAREDGANPPRLEVVVGSGPASPVAIQAIGTLDNSVSRTLSRPLTVAYQPPVTHSFRPGPAESEDAEIFDQAPNSNYGDAAESWVSSASNDTTRSLLRFDVGVLPAGARILEANLSLYRQSGSGADQPVSAHRILTPWSENSVTWNSREAGTAWDTPGGDFNNVAVTTTAVGPDNRRYEWDITLLVQGWVDGSYQNYGVAMIAAVDGMAGERFYTSDQTDPTRRPSLTVVYACECGSTCMPRQGVGNILMVIGNSPTNPSVSDDFLRGRFESWGYSVTFIQDDDSQGNFDAAVATHDVVYVSDSVSGFNVGTKLTDSALGVVNQEGPLNDELGIATGYATTVGTEINIRDTSHYISSPFRAGALSIYANNMELLSAGGTEAPQQLADLGGAGSLIAVDQGAPLAGGGTAAGRRVQVPLGEDSTVNLTRLNNNGWLILQRSLDWAIGAGVQGSGLEILFVVGDAGNPSPRDIGKKSLMESWGYNVTLLDDNVNEVELKESVQGIDVIYVSGSAIANFMLLQLGQLSTPLVNEEMELKADFGFSENEGYNATFTTLTTDNPHYINEPFAGGDVVTFSSNVTMWTLNGTMSDDLAHAGQIVSAVTVLATLDNGDRRWDGMPVTARRVQVPFENADVADMTADGQTLMRRSIEWAGGAGGLSGTFLDEFNAVAYDGNDGTLDWSDAWLETGESDGPGGGDIRVLSNSWCASGNCLQVREDDTSSRQLVREANLDGAMSAVLSLRYRRRHVGIPIGGAITLDISADGGVSFTPLQVYQLDAEDPAVMTDSFDISPFISTNTQIRFSTSSVYFGTAMYIDDVLIDTNGTAPTGPIAHWRLDDGTGSIAVDSIGGHDGTLGNGSYWVAGHLGDALAFDGDDDYVNLTSDTELDDVFDGGATVMAWIYPTSWGENGYGRILDKSSSASSTGDGWVVRMNKDNSGIINFGHGFTGGRGWWKIPNGSISLNTWQHISVAYDAGDTANDPTIYLDGAPVSVTRVDSPSGDPRSDASIGLRLGNYAGGTSHTFDGMIDDVRIYDEILGQSEIAVIAGIGDDGDGGGGGGVNYVEKSTLFTIAGSNSWQTVDLSVPGVPPDAIVEIAMENASSNAQHEAGIRAIGASAPTYDLHEAEGGGVDALVKHVQVDANGHIQAFAESNSSVRFRLMGYWTAGTYTNLDGLFTVGSSGSWQTQPLSGFGVQPGQIVEMIVQNTSGSQEYHGGVRKTGSGHDQMRDIQESEAGGKNFHSVFVEASSDASATIQAYAENTSSIEFKPAGAWQEPPGTYIEHDSSIDLGRPTANDTWQTLDLAPFGVPANAVVQITLANRNAGGERLMGVRAVGSSLDRFVDLHEAEAGGEELVTIHVKADANSRIEWYHERPTDSHRFHLMGWWILN